MFGLSRLGRQKTVHVLGAYLDFDKRKMAAAFYHDKGYVIREQSSIDLASIVNDFPGKVDCAVVVSLGAYKSHTVEKPSIPDDEVAETLRWDLAPTSPFDVETALVDYYDLPLSDSNDKAMVSVSLLPESELKKVNGVLTESKVVPSCISLPEMAVTKLLSLRNEQAACGGLLLSEKGSFFLVTHGEDIYLSRQLKTDLQLLVSDRAGSDKLIKECTRSINYFMGKFSHLNLSEVVYFTDRRHDPLLTELAERFKSDLTVTLKPYDYSALPVSTDSLASLGSQLALGMAILKDDQNKTAEAQGVTAEGET